MYKYKVIEATKGKNASESLDRLLVQDVDDSVLMLWDLDQEIAPILAQLPLYVQKELYENDKVIWNGYDIFYVEGKILCISKDHDANHKYYNLSQYYPHYEDLGKDIAQQYADQLQGALQEMKFYTRRLSSPATIYEDYYMKHLDLPSWVDVAPEDTELLQAAALCAGKEWTETFKIGYFPEVWEYDLASAYPTIMTELWDTRQMEIVQSAKYQPEALYGYLYADIGIDKRALVHPILYDEDGRSSTPTGERRDGLTKGQYDFIKRYALGRVDILDGWWLIPKKKIQPLEHITPRLLAYKESSNPLVKSLAKAMAVGICGKFGEEFRDRLGKHYNPMWFAEITTQCAMKVAEFIYQNKCWDNLIQTRVDSVLLTHPVSNVPSGWKMAYHGEAIVITTDTTFLGNNQHPPNFTLEEAKEELTEHGGKGFYAHKHKSVITLTDAYSKKQPKDLGMVRTLYTTIDLYRLKTERYFHDLPHKGSEIMNGVFESVPRHLK